MSRCLRRRGRAAAGGALVVLAAAALVVGWPLAPRATATAPFVVLQLNLCNGGFSPCFSGGKRSVDSAIALINDRQPDVVTLNEICARDITRMAQETGYRWQFMPVGTKGSGAPYQCSDGRGDYGIAVISNPKRGAARDAVVKQQYAHQDGGNQQLGYLCAPFSEFEACTTTLSTAKAGIAALQQCQELADATRRHNPATVLGGDFNLREQGNPDVRKCVPPGWFRHGDGDVQHVLATESRFTFGSAENLAVPGTDHPGLLVNLTW